MMACIQHARRGAADSIATRIPPSQTRMIGWLEDNLIAGLKGYDGLKSFRSFQKPVWGLREPLMHAWERGWDGME